MSQESSSVVLVMIGSKSVSICDRFYAILVIVAKIVHFKGEPKFEASVRKTLWTLRVKTQTAKIYV